MTRKAVITTTSPHDRYSVWWSAALSPPAPLELGPLLEHGQIEVTVARAAELRAWAAALPGWDDPSLHRALRHPLRFPGQMGRPATTGRGQAVTVRLPADDYAVIRDAAEARNVSVAEYLRTAGLKEATRKR